MLQYVKTEKKLQKKSKQTNKQTLAKAIHGCRSDLRNNSILQQNTSACDSVTQRHFAKNVAINLDHRVTTEMSQTFALRKASIVF